MKNLIKLLSFLSLLLPLTLWAKANVICSYDERETETTFFCMNKETKKPMDYTVPSIAHKSVLDDISANGARLVKMDEYLAEASPYMVLDLAEGPNKSIRSCWMFEKIAFTVDQFNDLPPSDPAIDRLKSLAQAMKDAGVCKVQVHNENYLNIGVTNNDELLHQFLCIANNESTLGKDNIGIGGRGPWGINPIHNNKRGSLCYGTQAVVRDANGNEDKADKKRNNRRYMTDAVRLDNAKCALKLYEANNGLRDWGKTKKWGSNRHCSKTTRDRLQFMKHLGPLGCCSQACMARASKVKGGMTYTPTTQKPLMSLARNP